MNENEILDTPDFHHSIPVQIRFNDIDMLGHVNNTVYFSFFDLGKARYFEEVKKGHFDLSHIDIVVANINVNFLAPITFYENVEVKTQVVSIGKSSFKMRQIIQNSDSGEVKCECTTIMVAFDTKKQCADTLKSDWIDLLCNYEQRNLCQKNRLWT